MSLGLFTKCLLLLKVPWTNYKSRFPEIKVIDLRLTDLGSSYTFSLDNPESNNLNGLNLGLNLKMNVSAYNPNLYDLSMDLIVLKVFISSFSF